MRGSPLIHGLCRVASRGTSHYRRRRRVVCARPHVVVPHWEHEDTVFTSGPTPHTRSGKAIGRWNDPQLRFWPRSQPGPYIGIGTQLPDPAPPPSAAGIFCQQRDLGILFLADVRNRAGRQRPLRWWRGAAGGSW